MNAWEKYCKDKKLPFTMRTAAVAELLDVSTGHVKNLANMGMLPCFRKANVTGTPTQRRFYRQRVIEAALKNSLGLVISNEEREAFVSAYGNPADGGNSGK
jgi:Mn-dependent DtxR family transcriptional regulator